VRAKQNQAQAIDRAQRPAADEAEVRAVTAADHFFANCVKSESENEIALAKFAQQHAQNEEVKKFVQQMIKDHTQCVEKLQSVASKDAARQTTAAAVQGADRPIQRVETKEGVVADNTSRAAAAQDIAGIDMMQLKKELSQQCLASLKAELERKSGPEFDRCFMGQQVLAHLAMWDALKVFQKHASPEFQPTLASAQQKTEQHLQEARRIAKDLDANAPRTASRAAKAAE
jgi:predicted outer membrane protein